MKYCFAQEEVKKKLGGPEEETDWRSHCPGGTCLEQKTNKRQIMSMINVLSTFFGRERAISTVVELYHALFPFSPEVRFYPRYFLLWSPLTRRLFFSEFQG